MKLSIVSVVIALAYLIFFYFTDEAEATMRIGAFLVFPLGLIWFRDSIGEYTGFAGGSSGLIGYFAKTA